MGPNWAPHAVRAGAVLTWRQMVIRIYERRDHDHDGARYLCRIPFEAIRSRWITFFRKLPHVGLRNMFD